MHNKISRKQAKEQGLLRYFTGVPCARGHINERMVRNYECIDCRKIGADGNLARNADRKLRKDKRYRERYKKELLEKNAKNLRRFRQLHPERALLHTKKYFDKNPGLRNEYAAQRRSATAQRLPIWFNEFDEFVWKEAHALVSLRNKTTSIRWSADHVIPLRAREASGLHVGNNCQVIPQRLNSIKLNRLMFLGAGEWIKAT